MTIYRADKYARLPGAALLLFVLSFACHAQEAAQPGSVFRDCDACPEMVVIPAGDYGFGSPPDEFGSPYNEGYILDIRFARPFALGKYEVTFDQWELCVRDGACRAVDDDGLGQPLPSRRQSHSHRLTGHNGCRFRCRPRPIRRADR